MSEWAAAAGARASDAASSTAAQRAPSRSWSASEIAEQLGQPAPTAEQCAIIQAPPDECSLVVAGAGSGKTETMAARVLWLVANGHVHPSEVLGLTFTRKAAGELADRMQRRIAALQAAGASVIAASPVADSPITDPSVAASPVGGSSLGARADAPGQPDRAKGLLDAPTVQTYHSFAGSIARESAALIGADGDAPVLGDAGAWLLAREAVLASDDARLAALDLGADRLADLVASLSAECGEHDVDLDALAEMAAEFGDFWALPTGAPRKQFEAELRGFDELAASLRALVPLIRAFRERKRERGLIEFSDQVALALRIVERRPAIAEALRQRYRVVILDEYQDTSVVQTRLLAALFAGHPVMAVGDPNQSIYGWRGASAANLAEFASWFGGETVHQLTTSWRNGVSILDAANRIIEPLRTSSRVPVDALSPSPVAATDPVDTVFAEHLEAEAEAVAAWFAARLAERAPGSVTRPSAALLLRKRSNLAAFTTALAAAGVPYHVLGVGGLLAEPVIADLVAALRVVASADAGSELIRLLAGSRWRIGTADLHELGQLARWLSHRDLAQRPLDDSVRAALAASVAPGDAASLVDALDFVAEQPEQHSALARFSPLGLSRLREAGALFARLRRRGRLDLADAVRLTIEELRLDLEAEANETGHRRAAAALESLFDAIDDFERIGDRAGLAAFLGWLTTAAERERLTPRSDPPEPGMVQILTVHGAKGLEWDAVAVPRLVEHELPDHERNRTGWLSNGRLPYEFRGDAAALPNLDWRSAETRAELDERRESFKEQVGERQLADDRRLAYVAVTRARRRLLLSGSFWATQKVFRGPSMFLRELEEAGVVTGLPSEPEFEQNPLLTDQQPQPWPRDPFGPRRARVEAAAALVRSAIDSEARPRAGSQLDRELTLLLTERAERLAGPGLPSVPERIAASRFKDWDADARAALEGIRRPMPERPFRATRLGTLFHAWVERRSDPGAVVDDLDSLPWEVDAVGDGVIDTAGVGQPGPGWPATSGIDEARFAELRAAFEASPWASLQPIEVEREILLPFDGRTVVCKLDAVYRHGERVEVVDWKTGAAPRTPAEIEERQLQLALYRVAYAEFSGLGIEQIDAALYYVGEGVVLRPDRLETKDELVARWRRAVDGLAAGKSPPATAAVHDPPPTAAVPKSPR